MKKNISLIFSFALVCLTFLTSYTSRERSRALPVDLLTAKTWKFVKAESTNDTAESVVNELYSDSHYSFQKGNRFKGEFFEFEIQGSWRIENSTLILNKGTIEEELLDIVELSANVLKLRTTENGAWVTIIYQ